MAMEFVRETILSPDQIGAPDLIKATADHCLSFHRVRHMGMEWYTVKFDDLWFPATMVMADALHVYNEIAEMIEEVEE